MKYQRVVITGIGAVTPIGLCVDEFWCGLVNGKSGIGLITHFDATKFSVKVAAEVKNFQPEMKFQKDDLHFSNVFGIPEDSLIFFFFPIFF